jgi:hypothetical protein
VRRPAAVLAIVLVGACALALTPLQAQTPRHASRRAAASRDDHWR